MGKTALERSKGRLSAAALRLEHELLAVPIAGREFGRKAQSPGLRELSDGGSERAAKVDGCLEIDR